MKKEFKKISQKELSQLAARASFLRERLENKEINIKQDRELSQKRYKMWQQKMDRENSKQIFKKRLRVQDLTPEKAKKTLGKAIWNHKYPIPEWIKDIEEILELFPVDMSKLEKSFISYSYLQERNDAKLIALFLPFLYYAEKQLLKEAGYENGRYSASAVADMLNYLLSLYNRHFSKVYNYELRVYIIDKNPLNLFPGIEDKKKQEKYQNEFIKSLLAGNWPEILFKYPVLARIMMIILNNWLQSFLELTNYLEAEKEKIKEVFNEGQSPGMVKRIETDLSDLHHGGRSIYILEFDSSLKLVYKPRDLSVAKAWSNFADFLNSNNSMLKVPRVLDFQDHGWMEYVPGSGVDRKEEVAEYFYNSGILLAIIYLLGGNDFHGENLIAYGKWPVIVDLETLLTHRVRPFNPQFEEDLSLHNILEDSILNTLFVPYWKINKKGEAEIVSPLFNEKNDNLPVYEDQVYNAGDYLDEVRQGFEKGYSLMLAHKEKLLAENSPLNYFKDLKFRFLLRRSQVYGDMLSHTISPEYLKNGFDYSLEIERMASAYLLSAPEAKLEKLWPVFLSEKEALEKRDIPIFYGKAEELALFDDRELLFENYFLEDAITRSKKIIAAMDKKDLRIQLDLLETSFSIISADLHNNQKREKVDFNLEQIDTVKTERIISELKAIYKELMDNRIENKKGEYTWIVRNYDLKNKKMRLGRISSAFYDGFMGVAVFMAAYYNFTREKVVKEKTLKLINKFRERLFTEVAPISVNYFNLGLGSGIAGFIRGFISIGHYLEDKTIQDDALYLALKLSDKQIAEDEHLDILGGGAGLILTLLDLYTIYEEEKVLELAVKVGEHLLEERIETKSGYQVWKTGNELAPLTGYGHGAAGIASVLYKLFDLSEKEKFRKTALEAMAYENSVYDPDSKNWPDFRYNPQLADSTKQAFMSGWCSGAPGVGLGRLQMLEFAKNKEVKKELRQDIENAIQFTVNYPMTYSDHLCCGNSSHLDFLIEAGYRLDRADLLEEARHRISWMIKRKEEKGQYTFNAARNGIVFNPSLFQGLSGVGYQFLRVLAPGRFRSVLK